MHPSINTQQHTEDKYNIKTTIYSPIHIHPLSKLKCSCRCRCLSRQEDKQGLGFSTAPCSPSFPPPHSPRAENINQSRKNISKTEKNTETHTHTHTHS